MSFAPQQPPGPNRQERQSEMEAITLQQERDEEERIRLAEEEAKNKAEAERLLKEQQARTLAAQQAAEATAFSANTTSKPTEIEETVKIKTNPVTGEQTTTLEEKVPAGVPTSIGPVSPNMEGGAAPIPLTPTATTVKPITPDMEGGAAPVAMGAGTLTPTVGAPGSVPTLQDTLGAANEAGATVTPGTTPATSGVDGQAGTTEQSFLDKTIDFLKSREKPDVPLTKPTMPGISSAKLGGAESTAAGGATLRPGQMQPTAPTPAVSPMQGGMQPVIQQPVAPQPVVSPQQMMPQGGGMLAPGADQPGPAIPQIGGMQPVSYQVPDNDAYAMAQQQNYPMDELGNYYAPNGQVISPGMTMADLTTASTQTPVSPGAVSDMEGGAAPVAMGTGTQTPVAPGQVLDMEGGAAPIALSDSPEVQLSKVIAVDSELPEVPKTQAELDALKAKNIADGGTEVGAIVEVDDSKDTIDAQIVKETDNALTNKNVDGLATLLVSDKVSPEKKDIIKENIKTITVNSIKEERAKRKADELFAKANAGDKNAPKQIANELKPSKSDDKGSYLKAYLFQRLGMTQAMNNEYKLLGLGTMQVSLTDSNGKFAGRATQAVDGRLVPGSAIGIDNKPISETQLASLSYLKSNTRSPYAVTKASMVYMPGTGKKGDADYIEAAGYQIETGIGKTPKIYDSTGAQVTDPTLAKNIMAQFAKKGGTTDATVGADTYMDPTGKVKGNWVLEKQAGNSVFRQVGTSVIANEEQANALRKTGVKGTLGDQEARLNLNTLVKLKAKHGENAIVALEEFRKTQPRKLTDKEVTEFIDSYGTLDLRSIIGNGSTGTSTGPVSPGESKTKVISSTGTTDMEGGAAPVKLQTENLKIKKADKPGGTTIVESETITAPSKTTVGIETSPGKLGLSTIGKPGYDEEGYAVRLPDEDIKKFADRQKAVQAEKARIVKNQGKLDEAIYGNVAELKINQAASEEEADNKIRLVGELLTHPGFKNMVGTLGELGYDQRALLIGDEEGLLTVPFLLQGTDFASWAGIYNQVKGKAFMEAFKGLKGGGQISNTEGAKASGAITRISNKASRTAFKEAVDDFVYSIKRKINIDRRSMGQEPKYKNLVNPSIARNKTKEAVENANKPGSAWSIKPKETN